MSAWQPLLDWWFAAEVAAARQGLWFGKRDSQDREAEARFGALVERALAGDLKDWLDDPQAWLAQLILLDQLPRMIFRDTPRAFAGDSRARPLHKALGDSTIKFRIVLPPASQARGQLRHAFSAEPLRR